MYKFGYSLTELEDMIPFEREIYSGLVLQELKQELENKKNS